MGWKPVYPGVFDIPAYVPGESKIVGVTSPIKLSSNESPFGASPKATQAALDAIQKMHLYADGGCARLRDVLGAHFSLDKNRIVCGAGSDDILMLLAQATAGAGDEVLYTRHGFLVYPIAASRVGATPVVVPEPKLVAEVDAILAAVTPRTKLVFLANPNNPTGTYLPLVEVKRLRKALPESVMLVVDEAYIEYATASDYGSALSLVDTMPNLAVTRTFSKIYGLASLRLGWGYMTQEVVDVLHRIRSPFNVPGPAQEAGIAAIQDVAFTQRSITHNTEWRQKLTTALTEKGFEVVPSQANFVLFRCDKEGARSAEALDATLKKAGIIVRRVVAYGLPDYLRVTVGKAEECEAFLSAF